MSKDNNLHDFLTDIADAVREKKGTSEPINAQNLSSEIRSIESGDTEYAFGETMADKTGDGVRIFQKIVIHDGVNEIKADAYSGLLYVKEVIIPDTVTIIGINAFYNCRKSVFSIPRYIERIGNNSFYLCQSITRVDIPETIKSIGSAAFLNCVMLSTFVCRAVSPPTLGSANVFDGTSSDMLIYVPEDSLQLYKSASNWSKYADKIRSLEELTNE